VIAPCCGRARAEAGCGDVVVQRRPEGFVVTHADPVAALSLLLARSLLRDPAPGVELALARPGEDPLRCCTYQDAVLRIRDCEGRSLVYRVTGCWPGAGVLVAEWPD
jgi:hypothetical protein